jgi:hypothetical protein
MLAARRMATTFAAITAKNTTEDRCSILVPRLTTSTAGIQEKITALPHNHCAGRLGFE